MAKLSQLFDGTPVVYTDDVDGSEVLLIILKCQITYLKLSKKSFSGHLSRRA